MEACRTGDQSRCSTQEGCINNEVGITETTIDDAIEKLLAGGYKVGRVEQLETSEQAKSRGSTVVIQRKLVNVLTPSTLVNGNIGHQVIHLLALKEGIRNVDSRVAWPNIIPETNQLSRESYLLCQEISGLFLFFT
ncbi:hypothetical protein L2E82_34227 [Cichorium intybus]|uniref:Uncharacterized protein n=1 Tax=Cichorium intybus TaxID=13427 RepID=A0ACB9BLS6_CICIN|nr:hypothetical protein L2E82_34227 [Cichorium intybus]